MDKFTLKKGQEHDSIRINMDKLPKPQNIDGSHGERCNNCGGYGYTVGMKGERIYCKDCGRTGVKIPSVAELMERIIAVEKDLAGLRKAILEVLPYMPHKVENEIKEAIHE